MRIRRLSLWMVLVWGAAPTAFGQDAFRQEQAYNRIQYQRFHWQVIHRPAFHLYVPKGLDTLAAFLDTAYQPALNDIREAMGAGPRGEPALILYPSIDQQYESNIGARQDGPQTFPTFVTKGSRLVLAYAGSRRQLAEQLRTGLARAAWEASTGQGVQSQLGTADLVPYWYREGAIHYFSLGWRVEDEDAFRALFLADSNAYLGQVIARDQKLAGQAFCYYLARQFQPLAVRQVFEQLRTRKNLPRALRLVTKTNADELYQDCLRFYQARFGPASEDAMPAGSTIALPLKRKSPLEKMLLSPDKKAVLYEQWQSPDQRVVYCYSTTTQITTEIARYDLPPWYANYSNDPYPLLAWQGNATILVTRPKKGKLRVREYSTTGTLLEEHPLYADGVSFLQATGANDWLLAAFRQGQSDILRLDARRNKLTALTNDRWDDAGPVAGSSAEGSTVFSSVRPLPEQDSAAACQGIFEVSEGKIQTLVADSLPYQEWQPLAVLQNHSLLVTNGKYGRSWLADITGSSGSHAIRAIGPAVPVQYLAASDEVATSIVHRDSLYISIQPWAAWSKAAPQSEADTLSPWLADYRAMKLLKQREDSILLAARDTTPSFLGGMLKGASSNASPDQQAGKARPYILQLYSAYFTAGINNDYYINRYQPYQSYLGQYNFPKIAGMVRTGFSDLFENHHFSVAYRLPTATEGSDFFVRYLNCAKKLDWGFTYFRKVESLRTNPNQSWSSASGKSYPGLAKVKTHYYELSLHHPLSYTASLDFTTAIRKDRTVFLATERYSLDFDPLEQLWSVSALSASVNRIRPTLPFLFKGYRASATLDAFKGFSGSDPFTGAASLRLEYHQPLYRYITLVARLQAGTSAGSAYVLYNMGGVDNNITPRTDSSVHFRQQAPYAFQTLITPLRGYKQNSLFGTTYSLINVDAYFPLLQTLIPFKTAFPSLNQLQLGCFADVAAASDKPGRNSGTLWSLGFSARTLLAAYPLRVDLGWPGSGGKAVWYLSIKL